MNIYSVDVSIVGTAYIKAASEEEAQALAAKHLTGAGIVLGDSYQCANEDICVDGREFSALAENDEAIALSPAFTLGAPLEAVSFVEELADA